MGKIKKSNRFICFYGHFVFCNIFILFISFFYNPHFELSKHDFGVANHIYVNHYEIPALKTPKNTKIYMNTMKQ